jgi:signal transduction histidine kinase
MKRIKIRYISLLFILFTVAITYSIYHLFEIKNIKRVESILLIHNDKLLTHVNALNYHQKNIADLIYLSTTQKPKVLEILSHVKSSVSIEDRDILRKKLYDILKNDYERIKTMGVLQYHFVMVDNRTFLRMHKPSKYDDNLSAVRYSFRYVNKNQKIFRGFDQGRTTHAFRNIYPIFDSAGNYLCALDISFPSDALQDYLTNIGHLHTHLLINKSVFDVKAWNRIDTVVKYLQSSEDIDYLLTMTPSHSVEKCITQNTKNISSIKKKIHSKIQKGKRFSLAYKVEDKIKVLSFLPIKEQEFHTTVAWIVAYEDSPSIASVLEINYLTRNYLMLIVLFLLYIAYRLLGQKNQLSQKLVHEQEKRHIQNEQLIQQSKLAQMGEMIDSTAHQWKQPLNAITLHTDLLCNDFKDDVIDKKYIREYQESMFGYVDYMTTTLAEFREFFKPNQKVEEFGLKEIINSISILLKDELLKNSTVVRYECNINPNIKANKNDIKQLFMNLIVNAKDEMINSDIAKDRRVIIISCHKDDKKLTIKVKDSANGIPDGLCEKIFEPRFTTKQGSGGTGIGLYMSTQIIKKYHGSIRAYNSEEGGAVFEVTIPRP